MNDYLNLALPPASLTQMCSAKIAINMVNSVLFKKSEWILVYWSEAHKLIENQLLDNIWRITLPIALVSYIRNYLIFVLSEIKSWYQLLKELHYWSKATLKLNKPLTKKVLGKIIWTGRGKIDREKTARNFVMASNLSLDIRYRLACVFHMEDLVRLLWKEMEADYQSANQLFFDFDRRNVAHLDIVYWSLEMMDMFYDETLKYIEEIFSEMITDKWSFYDETLLNKVKEFDVPERRRGYIRALICSLLRNNARSARFYASKCDTRDLAFVFDSVSVSLRYLSDDVSFSLISAIDRLTLVNLLTDERYNVFKALPSELFVKIFLDLESFVEEKDFIRVLLGIASHDVKEREGCVSPSDQNWEDVFYDVWTNRVPESYRHYVLNQGGCGVNSLAYLLNSLFHSSQFGNAELLLRNRTETLRRRLCEDIVRELNKYPPCIFNKLRFFSRIAPLLIISERDLEFVGTLASSEVRGDQKWEEFLSAMRAKISDVALLVTK